MPTTVTFGEIMLRLATPGFQRFSQAGHFEISFGGGEANVAVSLAGYGLPARFVTRLPKNDLGEACRNEVRRYGVDTSAMVWGGNRLGIYFLESGAAQRASKVIYDRAHSAIAEVKPGTIDWAAAFEGADWFHWTGITPAISESAAAVCKEAVVEAERRGLTVSVDLNYRAKLWGWGKKASEVMPDLVQHCHVLIGNEEDAEKVFGISAAGADVTGGHVDGSEYFGVCDALMKRFPSAHTAAITLRGSKSASHNSWSAVMKHKELECTAPTFDILPIVDRVGGGDSFVGGLIYGLKTYGYAEDALRFAVAASCLKHSIPGDFNLVSVDEVEKLMKGDASGRVSR